MICTIGKYVLPYNGFPFLSFFFFFCCAEAFPFNIVPFVYFSFVSLPLGDTAAKILLQEMSDILLLIFLRFLWFQNLHLSLIHFEFILVHGASWWSNIPKIYMEPKKTLNSLCNLEKEEQSWRYHPT